MSNSEKKKRGGNWIFNNNAIKILSVLVAALIWVVVAMTVGSSVNKTFNTVPVNINLQATQFAEQGLYPVEVDYINVTAMVYGDRIAVNQLSLEDLTATVKPSIEVNEPGLFTLRLVPANTSLDSNLLTSIQYTPSEVMVRVDRLITKNLKIEPVVEGLTTAEGFVQGAQTITPSQITVRGPRAEIEKIDRCVVMKSLSNPLEKTHVEDLPILLLDAQGEQIDVAAKRISMEYNEARLVIETLKRTAISLKVSFLNVPRNFPVDMLPYSMSAYSVEVAGPIDLIGKNIEEVVGYIDLRSVDKENDTFTFPLDIPSAYQNLEGINEVTVTFSSYMWEEASFNISGGVEIINKPDNYDVRVMGDTFYNVKFIGGRGPLSDMTSDDIVMEVDLAEREISEGQIRVPVRISAPTKGFVWAVGEYNVILEVTKNDQVS